MKVIIIDDDTDFSQTLIENFQDEGVEATHLTSIRALRGLNSSFTHAVVDLRLNLESGLDCIPVLKEKNPNVYIVLLTAYGSIRTTVEAIKKGADEYLLKPCRFKDLLNLLNRSRDERPLLEVQDKMLDLYQKEKEYIDYVLLKNNGNISRSAEVLGIKRQSLQRKLKKISEKKIE